MLALAMRPLTEEELLDAVEIELEAQHHLAAQFDRRRTEPADDVISTLVRAHEGEDGAVPLTVAQPQNLMHQLVTGGSETTPSALNHGIWLLASYPQVQDRLRGDRSLVPAFIDEVLRFESPLAGLTRRATRDVELNGVVIPEGAMVMIRYQAANRDGAAFDRPDEFDIDRERNNHPRSVWACTAAWGQRWPGKSRSVHSPNGWNARRASSWRAHSRGCARAKLHPVPHARAPAPVYSGLIADKN